MKNRFLLGMLLVVSTVMFVGCAGMKAGDQPMQFSPQKFDSGKYVSKVDNFQIILDASQTMGIGGQKNFQSAKNLIAGINKTLPADLVVNSGLRSFGHSDLQSKKLTVVEYGMTKYSAAGFQEGLDSIKYTGGNSPLAAALKAAEADLQGAGAKTAIVIVSDGLQMDDAPAAAAHLRTALGDQACIYTVWIGDLVKGQKLLEEVAQAGGCGGAYTGKELTSAADFDNFVKTVFLADKPAPPPAPKPAAVVEPKPEPMPEPIQVTKEVVTFNLLFGFDKYKITDEMIPILEQAKAILDEDKATRFTVAGHTDSTGPETYNQGLSLRRAASVRDWLIKNGIAASRLDVAGYGETQPKFDNATRDGRRLNRRVELQSH
jgi:OOP family OmpA-OmpF porin